MGLKFNPISGNLELVSSGGGGGVTGLTTPTLGEYHFAADPGQSWAVLTLGDATYTSGLIQGTRAADVGDGYGGDIFIYGGFTPDPAGHPGDILLSAGYRDDGSNYQGNIYIGGRTVEIQGAMKLQPMTTTQRDAVFPSPQDGDFCMNSTIPGLQIYYSGAWKTVTAI
jgi:hypothetical protein